MAVTLNSKRFHVSKNELMPVNEIRDWLMNVNRRGKDCHVVVTLELPNERRRRKKTVKAELEALAVDMALIKKKPEWKNGDYCFDFLWKKYTWKGEEIHITANEALFLFRWLVLKDEISKTQMQFLRNMRREHRLGNNFLKEVEL